MAIVQLPPSLISLKDELLHKDRWHVEELGLEPDTVHSAYYLDFSKITISWLKLATKKFVRLQSARRSLSSCRSYIAAIARLDEYLCSLNVGIPPTGVTRSLVIGFFAYLQRKGFGVVTRRTTIIHLRTFHLIVLQEEWLPWPEKPLVFTSDIPNENIVYPRYIPEHVITQLKKYLHQLSPYLQRIIIILLESGRRISEICTLVFDCLEQDEQQDWYMRVQEKKFHKIRLIPISNACLKAIKEQQKFISDHGIPGEYLFPSRRSFTPSHHISARYFNTAINKLAKENKITDANGKLWRFQAHQFRHTLATSMINHGVPQVVVQRYLGHESPGMIARYAHIHNETMKNAFMIYQEKLVDIHGKEKSNDILNAMGLKKNILSQALPNGLCTLSLAQKACPHANACLTCSNFSTSKKFLLQHQGQLEQTMKVIDNAKINGWQRIVEMNSQVAENLRSIIKTLENQDDE
jgi:integrase/recombinase XerD